MKIAMGSDHAGFPLKEEIKKVLLEQGYEVEDVGCYSPERFDYAISAQKACDLVVDGTCEKAILCCGTGIGISMAANKVKGIRAACCSDYLAPSTPAPIMMPMCCAWAIVWSAPGWHWSWCRCS